ncbi:MAG: DUF4394 domain-containing protein [Gemmatimonadota bacterium]
MTTRISLVAAALVLGACADAPTGSPALSTATTSLTVTTDAAETAIAGEELIGLTADNELVTFTSDKSNQTTSVVPITGLMAGETVIGIDFRPSDLGANGVNDIGKLYAVTSASRLYVVNPATGAASSPVMLSIAISGTAIGAGFNPVPDRLRIHTSTNQNLRINVETGMTTLDGALSYTAGDVNAGNDPDLVGTGYTNNDADPATGTDLYAIDAAQDVLIKFGPVSATSGPNSGKLLTVGALGVNASAMSGLDISNATGTAYAVLGTSPSDKSVLYSIDLATGAATRLGLLAQTKGALIGVVVKP